MLGSNLRGGAHPCAPSFVLPGSKITVEAGLLCVEYQIVDLRLPKGQNKIGGVEVVLPGEKRVVFLFPDQGVAVREVA